MLSRRIMGRAGWSWNRQSIWIATRLCSARSALKSVHRTDLTRPSAGSRLSLPLYGPGRLGRDVVDHPVDAAHLVDDAGGGTGQEAVLEGIIIRRHAVGGGDGAQGTDMVIGTAVAHHAHGLDREQHGEGLPDLVVQAGLADLVQIDDVGLAQDLELVFGDLARNADGQARPRKGMAADERRRQTQLAAQRAYLILEQLAQRL